MPRRAVSIARRLAGLGAAWMPWRGTRGPSAPDGSAESRARKLREDEWLAVERRLSALASRAGGGVAIEAVLVSSTRESVAALSAVHRLAPGPPAAPAQCALWVLRPVIGGAVALLGRLRERGYRLLSRLGWSRG